MPPWRGGHVARGGDTVLRKYSHRIIKRSERLHRFCASPGRRSERGGHDDLVAIALMRACVIIKNNNI